MIAVRTDGYVASGSLAQQLLWAPGATVTEVLEAVVGGSVRAIKLAETTRVLKDDWLELDAHAGACVLDRSVLLCTESHLTPLLYATSTILVDRIKGDVVRALLETDQPIGKVLSRYGAVAVSERCRRWVEPAAMWRALLPALRAEDTVLCRSHRLLVNGVPALWICERFPQQSRLELDP